MDAVKPEGVQWVVGRSENMIRITVSPRAHDLDAWIQKVLPDFGNLMPPTDYRNHYLLFVNALHQAEAVEQYIKSALAVDVECSGGD